jgi:hypothetical protein
MSDVAQRLDPANRRQFLKASAVAASGIGLGDLLKLQAQAQETIPDLLTGKSIIFLFLHGGPSQFETFDPKMTAPEGIRSATGEISTRIPGVTFGSSFPQLASHADKLTIVRSFVPGDADHNIKPIVSRDSFGANLGSIYARVAGPNHPVTGLPSNVLLFPRAVDPSTQPGTMTFGRFGATGPLASNDAPYEPGQGGSAADDLKISLPASRLEGRRRLQASLENYVRALENSPHRDGIEGLREQAYRLLGGGLADAFDISREDPRMVERYDTAPLVRPEAISKKWNNHKNYADNAKTLGKLLLLARRLCERGCGFVTVTTNFVWDMHADINNATMKEGMSYMAPPLDHALGTFLEDIHARGLQDKILLVACGEMGRTPRLNAKGGRDHWGGLGPLLLTGGGMPMGHIVGKSAKDGSSPQSEPVTTKNLIATLIHTMFDVGQFRLLPTLPREFTQIMASWQPIPGLLPTV